ncbi:hypothetical protein AB4Z54_55995, partial [Streptomyces sp. MCAF7]
LAPEETFTVDPAALHHRNQVTAYAGKTLYGVVRSTWLRGRKIAEQGTPTTPTTDSTTDPTGPTKSPTPPTPHGRLLERQHRT